MLGLAWFGAWVKFGQWHNSPKLDGRWKRNKAIKGYKRSGPANQVFDKHMEKELVEHIKALVAFMCSFLFHTQKPIHIIWICTKKWLSYQNARVPREAKLGTYLERVIWKLLWLSLWTLQATPNPTTTLDLFDTVDGADTGAHFHFERKWWRSLP